MSTMPTLWITGDSFSEIKPNDINYNVWSIKLSKKIKHNLANQSLAGVSQDWCWSIIQTNQHEITTNDQLIVVLTDAARFWFFEDIPSLSNSRIIDFENVAGSDRSEAASGYFKYIQRPALDIQMLGHRLGWLNNLSTVKGWKKPIIILGFDQYIPDQDHYTNLIFSNGTLADVAWHEEKTGSLDVRGWDTRYNHMCLTNHEILSEKLANAILYNTPIDLKSEFLTQIYCNQLIFDDSKSAQELDMSMVNKFREALPLEKTEHVPFYKRVFSK